VKRLSLVTLVFAVLSLVFFMLLVFLRIPFPLKPLMSWQDALDLLTPLVLIPVYWLLFRHPAGARPGLIEEIAFLILGALWVMSHGLHLSANSISNLMESLKRGGGIDATGADIFALTYFYDETLSHYLGHIGLVGLAALLIYREWRGPVGATTIWWQAGPAGLVYRFTLFCLFVEGQTVPVGLPFTALVVLFGLVWGRKRLAVQPVLGFFSVSCLVALALFLGWGLYWGGFPQFTEVGLI
jgi:hypothetical protein